MFFTIGRAYDFFCLWHGLREISFREYRGICLLSPYHRHVQNSSHRSVLVTKDTCL